jgi:hypothetical protein
MRSAILLTGASVFNHLLLNDSFATDFLKTGLPGQVFQLLRTSSMVELAAWALDLFIEKPSDRVLSLVNPMTIFAGFEAFAAGGWASASVANVVEARISLFVCRSARVNKCTLQRFVTISRSDLLSALCSNDSWPSVFLALQSRAQLWTIACRDFQVCE